MTTPTTLPSHLLPDREVHVIISTHSGSHSAQSYFDDTLQPFLTKHVPHLELKKNYFVHTTTSPSSISTLTRKLFLFNAKKGVKNTIILLSGDGGIVDILNTLMVCLQREVDDYRPPSIFFKPVVCLVPCGTANALATSVGIGSGEGRRDALEVLLKGRARALPQFEVRFSRGARLVTDEGRGRVEFRSPTADVDAEGEAGGLGYYDPQGNVRVYGCVVFSWGLHASLVALSDTAEMRKHGLERFKMAAGELLQEGHAYSATVKYQSPQSQSWQTLQHEGTAHTEESSLKHKYILATQVSNLEDKFCISPQSKAMDGSLRLLAIGDKSSETIVKILTLAYEQGKHIDECSDNLLYQEMDGLRIEFDEDDEKWRQICVDGKIVAVEQGGWVEVRRMPASGVDGRRVIELVYIP